MRSRNVPPHGPQTVIPTVRPVVPRRIAPEIVGPIIKELRNTWDKNWKFNDQADLNDICSVCLSKLSEPSDYDNPKTTQKIIKHNRCNQNFHSDCVFKLEDRLTRILCPLCRSYFGKTKKKRIRRKKYRSRKIRSNSKRKSKSKRIRTYSRIHKR
jgi:hypothetical protein